MLHGFGEEIDKIFVFGAMSSLRISLNFNRSPYWIAKCCNALEMCILVSK